MAGFHEVLWGTDGICLWMGPEAQNMLDPNFVITGVSDPKAWVVMPRLLECASGGPYEWTAATDTKRMRAARAAATQVSHHCCAVSDAG